MPKQFQGGKHMRINSNLSAMNTYSKLTSANNAKSSSLEKLSSGLRINRAGDDAAGLAISEKMRGQISGLNQAASNAQDAISLVQTAEGALNETHSILQRMRELAVQSSNDTNTDVDRVEIQKEIDQLATEITRISDTTEFNTQNLLGGKFNAKFHIGANKGQSMELKINDMSSQALKVSGSGEGKATYEITSTTGTAGANSGDLDNVGIVAGEQTLSVVKVDNITLADTEVANYGLADKDGKIVATSSDGGTYKLLDGAYKMDELSAASADAAGQIVFADKVISGNVTLTGKDDGTMSDIKATASIEVKGLQTGDYKVEAYTAGEIEDIDWMDDAGTPAPVADDTLIKFTLKNSDNEIVAVSQNGKDFYSIDDLIKDKDGITVATGITEVLKTDAEAIFGSKTTYAGGETLSIKANGGIDVSSQAAADAAIKTIDDAIATVSSERSKLGATQNRLDHTINNLTTTSENLSAAESRIRDVDMAKEMMDFTKNNILSQAATSMLAQANQMPQSVLQLLQ